MQREVGEEAVEGVDEDLVVANLPHVAVDEKEEERNENEVGHQHGRQPLPETEQKQVTVNFPFFKLVLKITAQK